MKKNFLPVLLFLISILFFACTNNSSSGDFDKNSGEDYITLDLYKKIDSEKIKFVGDDAELYMFVYNTSDSKIESASYENIFAGRARSAVGTNLAGGGIIPQVEGECVHYTCGLSSERIRNAYENQHLVKNTTRAVYNELIYNRSKNKVASNVGDEADFYKEYTTENGSVSVMKVKATCRYTNADCQVFVEDGYYDSSTSEIYIKISDKNYKITQAGIEKLAAKFSSIYKVEQALLGEAKLENVIYNNIIETSEKITIFVSNLGIEDKGGMVMGYFSPNDLRCDLDSPFLIDNYSNQRMMFALNVLEYKEPDGESMLYHTLGHEFNHMINYITKILINNTSFDSWFTEMLSSIAEDFLPEYLGIENSVQESRVPFFNVTSYAGLVDWGGNGDILNSYGFAYAFGAYLVRNYGGVELVYQMATNQYYGKQAITAALKACGYGETFESVFLKFGLVMVNADGKDSAIPTLNKRIIGSKNSYSYIFEPVYLCGFNQIASSKDMKYFCNPNWSVNNKNGPCFYNYSYCPSALYGIGFYATYLGKASEWRNSLRFNPPSGNVQAYIYVCN